jgi:multiple sugar transport system permease protein
MTSTTAPPLAEALVARPAKRRREGNRLLPASSWWIICTCLAILFASPLLISLLSSFKTTAAASATNPTLLPSEFSLENYQSLQGVGVGIGNYVMNSVLVTLGTVVGTVILSTMAGFGFEKYGFFGRNTAFMVIVAMLMIPFQAVVTPLYIILNQLGFQNSLVGVTLVYITYQLPFALFVMRNSFAGVPQALEEAALVDGASSFRMFRQIMLPLVRPGVITVALFAFFAAWNEFFAALILLSDQSQYTLPVALTLLQGSLLGQISWGTLQAGVMVSMVPCVIIYAVLQRYYVAGLLSGGIK